jgi:uncharacterized protein YdeI (YjbR/CyaY-like superfamily)
MPALTLEIYKGFPSVAASQQSDWRKWLLKNHRKEKSVWLILYKKDSGKPSVQLADAIDEALCFGWIDSKPNKRDEESYYVFFSQRKPKSKWSAVNKAKVERLIAENRMHASGMEMVTLARESGTWDALTAVDALKEPDDLLRALKKLPPAITNWKAFPKSTRRGILEWILNAKTEATRQKRIDETARLAREYVRANQYRR